MKTASRRYIIYGQACFYLGLILCIIIRPKGLGANAGISYYGVYKDTILPYVLALLGSAYFSIKVAEGLDKNYQRIVKYALTAMGLLAIGVMVTPDTLSSFADLLHRSCGIALFVIQLLLSGWLIVYFKYNLKLIFYSLIELAGGIASFIYLAPPNGYLLQTQVIFQLGFGLVLINALKTF